MAENKQYITQVQENGNVMISEDVITTVVEHAVCEVEGIVGLDIKPGADIAEMIGKRSWGRGIKIVVCEDDSLIIDCNVTVRYDHCVVTVAKAAQEAVTAAVESITGVRVAAINVNICGIVR